MAALFMDGFDTYGTDRAGFQDVGVANMLNGVWAGFDGNYSIRAPSWGAARTGTNCLALNTPFSQYSSFRRVIPGAPAKMFVSFGFSMDQLPPDELPVLIDTRNSSNQLQYRVTCTPTGAITLRNGSDTLIASTTGPVLKAQTWHFVEICFDYSTGVFTMRVDDPDGTDSPILTHGIATGTTNAIIGLGSTRLLGSSSAWYWDDLFVRDASGSVNNDWLGDRRVATSFVNADTATAGWTPSYYKKFGPGVLRTAYKVTNNNTPINQNACATSAGATSLDLQSEFTWETFVRFEAFPRTNEYASIFSRWDTAHNGRQARLLLGGNGFNGGCLQFDTSTDGTAATLATPILYPWEPDLNVWYHIALVRAAGELLLFVNGEQLGLPIANTATYFPGTMPFGVGAECDASGIVNNTYVTGMFDETRFTNGYARYTAPFAVPTDPFPRGSALDPQWADVVLLAGYDSGVQDESSFARGFFPQNGAISYIVNDGAGVGAYSTIDKPTPDDNTFITAGLTSATSILTMTTQPANGNTVTVGTKDGTVAAVYTFKTTLASAYDVLIDTTAENTLLNLQAAINSSAGAGTKFGAGTVANFDVLAIQLPAGQIEVQALIAGTTGNSIATSKTGTAASWTGSTLAGGANIPGPSAFKMARPPANTTIISAIQTTVRASKSDSGTSSIRTSLIGPLGALANGTEHHLAISPDFYNDIMEHDPDTSGPITPATLINGKLQINRTE